MKTVFNYIKEALVNHKVKNIGEEYKLYYKKDYNKYYVQVYSDNDIDELCKYSKLMKENIDHVKLILRGYYKNYAYIRIGQLKNGLPKLFAYYTSGNVADKDIKFIKKISSDEFTLEYFKSNKWIE